MVMTFLTLPSSPSSFWQNTNDCHPPPTVLTWFGTVTFSYCQKWNWSWKEASLIPLKRSGPNCRECLTL
jgi:hypothetical protein